MSLAEFVCRNPSCVSSCLQALTCSNEAIREIDPNPQFVALFLAESEFPYPHCVAAWSRCFPSRSDGGTPPRRKPRHELGTTGDDKSSLNIALCHRIRSIDLEGNCLSNTVGLCLFQNVTTLRLAKNRLFTIDDVRPLHVLRFLRILTLESNPVSSLLTYRAHVLSICSENPNVFYHATTTELQCRLERLDSRSVDSSEVVAQAALLQTEAALMYPALRQAAVAAALSAAHHKLTLHHEMRRRGTVLAGVGVPLTVERLLQLSSIRWADPASQEAMAHSFRVRCAAARSSSPKPSSPRRAMAQVAVDIHEEATRKLLALSEALNDATFDVMRCFTALDNHWRRCTANHDASTQTIAATSPQNIRTTAPSSLVLARAVCRATLLRKTIRWWHRAAYEGSVARRAHLRRLLHRWAGARAHRVKEREYAAMMGRWRKSRCLSLWRTKWQAVTRVHERCSQQPGKERRQESLDATQGAVHFTAPDIPARSDNCLVSRRWSMFSCFLWFRDGLNRKRVRSAFALWRRKWQVVARLSQTPRTVANSLPRATSVDVATSPASSDDEGSVSKARCVLNLRGDAAAGCLQGTGCSQHRDIARQFSHEEAGVGPACKEGCLELQPEGFAPLESLCMRLQREKQWLVQRVFDLERLCSRQEVDLRVEIHRGVAQQRLLCEERKQLEALAATLQEHQNERQLLLEAVRRAHVTLER